MTKTVLLTPSPYEADDGELIGRDPRTIPGKDWRAAGHTFTPAMKAIRAKCVDCCGGQHAEVRKCVATDCPLWPMRMGCYAKGLANVRNA